MEQPVSTIIKFSFIPTLLVAAYTWYVFKKLPYELRVFARFIFLSGLIELISRIYWFNSKNNMPLLHIYVAAGFFFLTQFYQEVLKGFIDRNIIRTTLIFFLVFTTVNSLFVQSIFTFNSYALTVESILIIIFSLSTYMLMLNDIVRENRLHLVKSLNWINSGLFIYYSSSLLIFHFGNLITLFAPSSVKYAWMFHSFFSIVMYCCFFVGLWNRQRN